MTEKDQPFQKILPTVFFFLINNDHYYFVFVLMHMGRLWFWTGGLDLSPPQAEGWETPSLKEETETA